MKKKFTLLLTALFIGCGGGSNNSSPNIIKGKVIINGYIKNAKVCIDLNNNFKCDKNEPFDFTDEYGNYYIHTNYQNKNYTLIATGGIDTNTNQLAITMYSKIQYEIITPLTTLAVKYGEKSVAEYFNISPNLIYANPLTNNEIKNICIEINNQIKENGNFDLKHSNNINLKNPSNNVPPQIIGNLTPPQIGL